MTTENKAPAFQFYASDFLTDTLDWTVEEVGAYIRLLATQWVNKELSSDTKRLSRIVGMEYENFIKIWSKISEKFEEKNGKIFNKKLEKVRKNREIFIENASKAGIEGNKKRWGTRSGSRSKPDRENIALQSSSSSSSSISTSKEKIYKKEIDPDIEKIKEIVKTVFSLPNLDKKPKANNDAARRLINKYKKHGMDKVFVTIEAVCRIAKDDKWWGDKVTSVVFLENNFMQIANLRNNQNKFINLDEL
jgi:uncharacterized protein YdaU (DUF1376 family)